VIRQPAVAGQFYPASASQLEEEVKAHLERSAEPVEAVAAMVPHAGYAYSGPVAGAVYGRLQIPDTVVILAPNHTGLGAPISVWSAGAWVTPLGEVAVDEGLASALLESFPPAVSDDRAHLTEHAIEVQLPFLQVLRSDVKILPVVLATDSLATLQELGECLSTLAEEHTGSVLLLASTDMTHFQPQAVAERYDKLALERVLALDGEGLCQVVLENDISMCGYMPTAAALYYARCCGADSAELIRYETSGDHTGDFRSVVGYAGAIIC